MQVSKKDVASFFRWMFYSLECWLFCMFFPPFTGFTFFNQIPYSSAIQGEGPLPLSALCVNTFQAPGIRGVSLRHTGSEHRSYRRRARLPEKTRRAFTLYCRWIGYLIKKGEAGEGGKFYVDNVPRWTKSPLGGSFQNEMAWSNRNNISSCF